MTEEPATSDASNDVEQPDTASAKQQIRSKKDTRKLCQQVETSEVAASSIDRLFDAFNAFQGDSSISDEQRVPVCKKIIRQLINCFEDNKYRVDFLYFVGNELKMRGVPFEQEES